MPVTINASPTNGLVQTADGSGIMKLQSNGVTTNALAWATFTGSTGAILSSYNISSITRNGTGSWTTNFTNALTDNNYSAVGGSTVAGGTNYASNVVTFGDRGNAYGLRSTTQLQVFNYAAAASTFNDPTAVSFVVFGN